MLSKASRKDMALIVALLLVLVVCSMPVEARRFSLFAFSYLDPQKRPSIKVSSSLTYRDLVFLKKTGFYESVYELYITVHTSKGKPVDTAVLKKKVIAREYKETKSNRKVSKLSRSFQVKPGRYMVEATLKIRNTAVSMKKIITVEVPDFLLAGVGISQPRLFAVDRSVIPENATVVKMGALNQEGMEELESNSFADLYSQPAVLFEVYTEKNPPDSIPCAIYVEAVDQEKKQLFYGRESFKLRGQDDKFCVYLNADDWEPGSYKLNAKVVLEDPHREAVATMKFVIEFTRAMLGRRFDDTIAILSIIAGEKELKKLENSPYEKRVEAWEEFWKRRDPNPETEENEALVEHLRRVRYTIENFSVLEPGWRTDRGRVYIKYGEPDQVDTSVDPYFQGEYQIWRYFSYNLVFVFYDRFGLGNYRLLSVDRR